MTLDTYSYLFLKYILVWSGVSRLETTPVENEYFTTERLNINNVALELSVMCILWMYQLLAVRNLGVLILHVKMCICAYKCIFANITSKKLFNSVA